MVSTTLTPISKLFMRVKSTHLAHWWCTWWSFGGSKFKTCWEPERDWACLFHGNTPKDRNPIYHPCNFGARQPHLSCLIVLMLIDLQWHRRDVDQTLRFLSSPDVQCLIIFQYGASHFVESCYPFLSNSPKDSIPPKRKPIGGIEYWHDGIYVVFDLSSIVNHPHRPLLYRYIQ